MALQAPINYNISGVVDPAAAFEQGQLFRQKQESERATRERATQMQQAIASLPPNASVADINNLIMRFPELEQRFKKQIEVLGEQEKQAKFGEAMPIFAALISGKPSTAESMFRSKADALRNSGDEPGAKAAEMQADLIKNDPVTARTTLGISLAALMGGDKFAEVFSKLEETRRANELQPFELQKIQREVLREAEGAGFDVQSSQILPNGVVVMVTRDGQRIVRDKNGTEVLGSDAALAIEEAARFGISTAAGRAGAEAGARAEVEARTKPTIEATTEASKEGQRVAADAFKSLGRVRSNISNLQRAKELVLGGANTGVISSRLPDLFASSVELSNLRNRLGLDVVSGAGFGALSEGELALALNTALPTNLPPKELAAWLDRKIAAQKKAAIEFEKVARFLRPGRTIQDWLDSQGIQPAAPAGAVAPGKSVVVDY